MERFFRVEVGSPVDSAYHEWEVETSKIRIAIQAFFRDKGIESPKYRYGKTGTFGTHAKQGDENSIYLGITPTKNDLKNFGSQICKKENSYEIRYFKKNSVLRKEFAKIAIDNTLCKLEKPCPGGWEGFYNHTGPSKNRLFYYNDILYGSIEANEVGKPNVEGIIEMPGSEFYKILEAIEIEENGGTENGTN